MLDGSDWSTSRPSQFTPGKDRGNHPKGDWMGPTAGLDDLKKKRVSYPCRDSNPGSSSPWPSRYTNHAIVSVSSAAMQDYGPNTDCVRLQRQTMQTLTILHVTLTVKLSPYMPSRQWRAVEIQLYPYSPRRQKGGRGSQRPSRERDPIPISLYRRTGLEGSEKSRPSPGFQTPDHPVANRLRYPGRQYYM